ncbi:hypothetical protein HYH03_003440 [Edaphochlamys debaryana]|uniref:Uncharacterized protein n=1 Tax=Edaphochlamys debaryana TaxID=47281 RepID=A0A836C3E4_9CHLO|nr:hypothetical protein HYH03_003440 [Edaphochlamys debaryana]|eukprot:KAG2498700.1 hypothetical protein HYH03_003440 [Edaphochlamys debaryana]
MANSALLFAVAALVAASMPALAQRQWSEAAFAGLGHSNRSPPPRHRPPPKHRAPSGPEPIPCRFFPATTDANGTVTSTSRCFVNTNFINTLVDTVGKMGSPQVRVDLTTSKNLDACRAYNFTADPNAKQACYNDRKNRCYVWLGGTACTSGMPNYLQAKDVFCPGSNFQKFSFCTNLYKDECTTYPECVWSEAYMFGGPQFVDTKKAEIEAWMGGPLNVGACYWKPYVDYMLLLNGTVRSGLESRAWGEIYIGSNLSNKTVWEATRGTCDFAQRYWRRYQYTGACAAVNTVVNGRSRELNMTDYAALNMCEAAGCTVAWNNNYLSYSQGRNVSMSSFTCVPNLQYVNSIMYDAVKDGRYFDAINGCITSAVQGSEDRCLGVRV